MVLFSQSLIHCSLFVLSSPSLSRSASGSNGIPSFGRYSRWTLVNCSQQLEVISRLLAKVWIISRAWTRVREQNNYLWRGAAAEGMKLKRSERTGASERKDCSVGHLTKHKSVDRSARHLALRPESAAWGCWRSSRYAIVSTGQCFSNLFLSERPQDC